MNMIKRFLSVAMLCSAIAIQANHDGDCFPSPTFVPRSQGSNTMLKLVGEVGQTHLYDMDCWWGTFDITPLYSQSFRSQRITDCLFGRDALCNVSNCSVLSSCDPCNDCDGNSRSILIQGSAVANRNANAWLADYFYLPPDFQSQIRFSPRIKNFLLNLDLYVGLDEWMCGMYFRLYGPVTWTKWELNFCESICDSGTFSYTAGYFAPTAVERSSLVTDFTSYANGATPNLGTVVTANGLRFARINNCDESRTGFADLWIELGWDFLNCEDYHLGAGILAGAPTGSKRHACRLFDPVIGNGNHWQLGGVVTGHYVFWRSCEEDKYFGFYFDANITHLFRAHEERTYDLCGRPNSRYMLAERLTSVITNNLGGNVTAFTAAGSTLATAQFANEYTPVANLTTFDSNVKVGVQGDVTAMFNFTGCGFSWDFGYNFWGRSCESIDCNSCNSSCNVPNLCDPNQAQTWALKGDARVYGFVAATAGGLTEDTPVALSATERCATIHGGTNATATTSTNVVNPALQNEGVDNAQFAVAGTGFAAFLIHTPISEGGLAVATNQIKTSIQPVFLRCEDIDFRETRGISHKVFTHLSYVWDCECWIPYLGIGGSAEFGRSCNNDCNTSCNTTACNTSCPAICNTSCDNCTSCALSQWAVWIKGGVSFN